MPTTSIKSVLDQYGNGIYTSSMTGADTAALFLPAADSFPRHPVLSLPLSDPGLVAVLEGAGTRINYPVI